MRVGYPCINRTLECRGNSTFRLDSYSEDRLIETVENNLRCLKKMLKFNVERDIFFFRITSDLVPFASHEVNDHDWQGRFKDRFREIGEYIKENNIRISMHPDQFIVLNSKKERVWRDSTSELDYHADVLDAMGLPLSAKIQLHVGGVYGNKEKSMERFISRYNELDDKIRERLVIENDDVSYTLQDCLKISSECGVPVLFDHFHHQLNSSGESLQDALERVSKTWKKQDGIPMTDYSSQQEGEKTGKHAESIDMEDFRNFLEMSRPYDFDVMFEIKDKEKSALKALEDLKNDERFNQ